MNGDSILTKEVGDDIRKLEHVPPSLHCDWGRNVMAPALVRALRLGEAACRSNRVVILLLLVLLSNMQVKGFSVLGALLKLVGL